MKKLGVLVLATGMLLGVSGCSEGEKREVFEWVAVLEDGRQMDCINTAGGTSCDWANAR